MRGYWVASLIGISVVIVGLIFFGGNFNPFGTISQTEFNEPIDAVVIKPKVTTVTPTKFKLTPQIQTLNSVTHLTEKTSTSHSPLSQNEAYGFLSSLNSVEITEWQLVNFPSMRDIAAFGPSPSLIYWPENTDRIGRLDPATNTITYWNVLTPAGANAAPDRISIDPSGDIWWIETNDKSFARLNTSTDMISEWALEDVPSNFFVARDIFADANNRIWLAENTGSTGLISMFNPANANHVRWSITPSSGNFIVAISASIPDSVEFLIDGADQVGRLNPSSNTVTLWNIPTPNSITSTSYIFTTGTVNHRIFFTEDLGNDVVSKIAMLDTSTNQFTEWNIPTVDSRPQGITFDDGEGAVYFAETGTDKIGRLVLSTNTITEWSIPGVFTTGPIPITFDADGDVWFGEFSRGKIARLSEVPP